MIRVARCVIMTVVLKILRRSYVALNLFMLPIPVVHVCYRKLGSFRRERHKNHRGGKRESGIILSPVRRQGSSSGWPAPGSPSSATADCGLSRLTASSSVLRSRCSSRCEGATPSAHSSPSPRALPSSTSFTRSAAALNVRHPLFRCAKIKLRRQIFGFWNFRKSSFLHSLLVNFCFILIYYQ